MPIYEYKCSNNKCSTEIFEIIQSFSDKSVASCPECKAEAERIISAFSVHFKGSGWYSTSNRSSNTKSKTKSTKDKSKNEKKAQKKNEAKKPTKKPDK